MYDYNNVKLIMLNQLVLYTLANFPTAVMELSGDEIKEWFSPKDFMIGKTIQLKGKRFLM